MALRHPLPLGLGQRRLAAAAVMIGVTIAADLWLATYKSPNAALIATTHDSLHEVSLKWPQFFSSPAWVVPSALGIGLLGLAAAAIVLGLRLTAAALTLGAGLAGAVALHTYLTTPRIPTAIPEGLSPTLARPGWVGPTALAIVLLALATANVLVAARRSSPP
jgi:hypothetical protein